MCKDDGARTPATARVVRVGTLLNAAGDDVCHWIICGHRRKQGRWSIQVYRRMESLAEGAEGQCEQGRWELAHTGCPLDLSGDSKFAVTDSLHKRVTKRRPFWIHRTHFLSPATPCME